VRDAERGDRKVEAALARARLLRRARGFVAEVVEDAPELVPHLDRAERIARALVDQADRPIEERESACGCAHCCFDRFMYSVHVRYTSTST
jgi:hypothetical protein